MATISIGIVANAARALPGFSGAEKAAKRLGSAFDGASEKTDNLASKSGTLTGALGAVGGGLGLVGLEKYSGALETAATASDLVSGASDLVTLALQSSALAKAKDVAAMAAHKVASAASAVATGVMTSAQWALNAAMSANPIGLVVLAIAGLVAAVVIAYKKSETFRNIVNGAFRGVQKVVGSVVGFFQTKMLPFFKSLPGKIVGFIRSLPARYIGVWRTMLTGAFNLARSIGGRILGWIGDMPGKISGLGTKMLEAGKSLIGKFFKGLGKLGNIGVRVSTDLMNGVIGGINTAINALNDLIPNSVKIGKGKLSYTFDLDNDPFPTIPKLATGGTVTGPHLVMAGDNASGVEYFLPKELVDRLAGKNPGGAQGINVYEIKIEAGPATDRVALGRELVRAIEDYERAGGRRRAS